MASTGNMLIAQSGGPTAAVNASLAGAVERAIGRPEIGKIFGARHGVEGVLREDLVDLRAALPTEEDLLRLKRTPAMALGSCRKRLPPQPGEEFEALRDIFRRYDIRYFFYIGGNDSMDTVRKLSAWFREAGDDTRIVGIPKTIDNDLACTDHTPGFGSAARYIATSVMEVAYDSRIYNIPSITLVEIMGRNAGWLTAAAALARQPGCTAPHIICMPEIPFRDEVFLRRVEELRDRERQLVIAVSEGIRYPNGEYVAAAARLDAFGHQQLAGAAHRLGAMLREKYGCKVRSVEPNVLQRAAGHLPSETDLLEASRAGEAAVDLALEGNSGVMVTLDRVSDEPYRCRCGCVDVGLVANVEKTVPVEWIDGENLDIRPELRRYLAPLVADPDRPDSGLPGYFTLSGAK